MKNHFTVLFVVVFFLLSGVFVFAQEKPTEQAQEKEKPAEQVKAEVLTNADVIALVGAGVSEDLIAHKIRTSPNAFDVSVKKLTKLKAKGVPDPIVRLMYDLAGRGEFAPRTRPASFREALASLKGQPVAVGEVSRQGMSYTGGSNGGGYTNAAAYADAAYLAAYQARQAQLWLAIMRATYGGGWYGFGGYGGMYGGGYGFGFPVYSDVAPDETLRAAIQAQLEDALEVMGATLIAPTTGPGNAQLGILDAEAQTGRESGRSGNHTWDTARYVVYATYRIDDEKSSIKGVDGGGLERVARIGEWHTSGTAQEVINIAGDVLGNIYTAKGQRRVEGTLSVRIEEVGSRRVLYTAKGTGFTDVAESDVKYIAGVYTVMWRQPNAGELARNMVAAALGYQEKPTK